MDERYFFRRNAMIKRAFFRGHLTIEEINFLGRYYWLMAKRTGEIPT